MDTVNAKSVNPPFEHPLAATTNTDLFLAPVLPHVAGREESAPRSFDARRIERAVREILLAIGEDPDREGLVDTPARVARAYREIFAGMGQDADEHLCMKMRGARNAGSSMRTVAHRGEMTADRAARQEALAALGQGAAAVGAGRS